MSPSGRGGRPDVPRGAVTAPDGILLVDKDPGVTSHDVVAMTRRMAATRKVGHAGTLDPMATGLLVLGIGRATRFLTYLVGADKTYEATVRLGQETLTEDAEGEVTASAGCTVPSEPDAAASWEARLAEALARLTGPIMQVPSAVSAIKVDGVRSYARVRQGEDVALAARPVTIHELAVRGPVRPAVAEEGTAVVDLDLVVGCSSGTYVRALARDLGNLLGCGGHLTALRRTAVGPFSVSEADDAASLAARVAEGAGREPAEGLATLPMEEVARRCFASLEVSEEEARAIGYGQGLPLEVLGRAEPLPGAVVPKAVRLESAEDGEEPVSGPVVAAFAPDGRIVALLTRKGGRARPALVLAPSS